MQISIFDEENQAKMYFCQTVCYFDFRSFKRKILSFGQDYDFWKSHLMTANFRRRTANYFKPLIPASVIKRVNILVNGEIIIFWSTIFLRVRTLNFRKWCFIEIYEIISFLWFLIWNRNSGNPTHHHSFRETNFVTPRIIHRVRKPLK